MFNQDFNKVLNGAWAKPAEQQFVKVLNQNKQNILQDQAGGANFVKQLMDKNKSIIQNNCSPEFINALSALAGQPPITESTELAELEALLESIEKQKVVKEATTQNDKLRDEIMQYARNNPQYAPDTYEKITGYPTDSDNPDEVIDEIQNALFNGSIDDSEIINIYKRIFQAPGDGRNPQQKLTENKQPKKMYRYYKVQLLNEAKKVAVPSFAVNQWDEHDSVLQFALESKQIKTSKGVDYVIEISEQEFKEVDSDTEGAYGAEPTEKDPQDASQEAAANKFDKVKQEEKGAQQKEPKSLKEAFSFLFEDEKKSEVKSEDVHGWQMPDEAEGRDADDVLISEISRAFAKASGSNARRRAGLGEGEEPLEERKSEFDPLDDGYDSDTPELDEHSTLQESQAILDPTKYSPELEKMLTHFRIPFRKLRNGMLATQYTSSVKSILAQCKAEAPLPEQPLQEFAEEDSDGTPWMADEASVGDSEVQNEEIKRQLNGCEVNSISYEGVVGVHNGRAFRDGVDITDEIDWPTLWEEYKDGEGLYEHSRAFDKATGHNVLEAENIFAEEENAKGVKEEDFDIYEAIRENSDAWDKATGKSHFAEDESDVEDAGSRASLEENTTADMAVPDQPAFGGKDVQKRLHDLNPYGDETEPEYIKDEEVLQEQFVKFAVANVSGARGFLKEGSFDMKGFIQSKSYGFVKLMEDEFVKYLKEGIGDNDIQIIDVSFGEGGDAGHVEIHYTVGGQGPLSVETTREKFFELAEKTDPNWENFVYQDKTGNEDYPGGYGTMHDTEEYWNAHTPAEQNQYTIKFLKSQGIN